MSTRALPKFESPPVIETVIGLQFAPIAGFTNAHAGWFWKSYLDNSWDRVVEVPRLQDVFERFGDERVYGLPATFALRTGPEAQRTQIICSDTGRMIQVQDTRLILNWRKSPDSAEYPSFDVLNKQYEEILRVFSKFAKDVGTDQLDFNQWEVVYVNHIPKGEIWNSLNDWNRVLSFFSIPPAPAGEIICDTFAGQWVLELPSRLGRLHIAVQHGRTEGSSGGEVMVLQLTARGPIREGRQIAEDLAAGHDEIVSSFANMTTAVAHEHWKRTQ